MTLDQWQALGIVCGALLALFALVKVIYRRAAQPMWRAVKTWTRVAEDLLGDTDRGVPSLMDRLKSLDESQRALADQQTDLGRQLAEHLEWHSGPGGVPASPAPARPNGGTTTHRRVREG